jgi:DNA-binding response OmpR family regulator
MPLQRRLRWRKKILVVDDEPGIVQLLAENLANAGYQVVTALDGPEAIRKATAERPDLIVMDDLMPSMDGREVLRSLQADLDSTTAAIPVIMVAQEPQEMGCTRHLPYHWDCYLMKPVDPSELLMWIRRIFDAIELEEREARSMRRIRL